MHKPKGLSFYKRLEVNKFLSVNPSTNGLSISIGIPGARFIAPVITFTDRPPMVNVQKFGIRYRKYLVNVESLLNEAKDAAADDPASAARLYRRAQRYACADAQLAEICLGRGYIGKRRYAPLPQHAVPEDYLSLGASIRGNYEQFVRIIEEIRKNKEK